jgi:hypothetical protein
MRKIVRRSIVTSVILILCLLTLDLSIQARPKTITHGQWRINGAFQQDQGLKTTKARDKERVGDSWEAAKTRSIKVPGQPGPPNIVAARPLIISEFRLNGTNGANDEFIEIYNASNSAHTVNSSDGSVSGYAVAASDGAVRVIIPQGTVIPARGHFLGCNSVGYSLTSYPSGNNGAIATTATCDDTYTTNISNGEDPDGAGSNPPLPRRGIALFSTSAPGNFNTGTRLDAVGPTEEANTLYKEGTGVRNLSHFSTAHSYVRRLPGGCIGTDPDTVDANCTSSALVANTPPPSSVFPQDTDNNRDDFIFVDTNGTPQSPEGTQQRLGAPGPENSTSPIVRSSTIKPSLVFPCVSQSSPPNRVRDFTQDTANESFFGTLDIRRKFTNNTGASITRLRFRIVDITAFPSKDFVRPAGTTCGDPGTECAADLRPRTSLQVVVANPAECGGGTVNVQGTTLEEAAGPESQPNSGAFNSSLSAGTVTLATPLANNASINVRLLFGVQQRGTFRVFLTVEALP